MKRVEKARGEEGDGAAEYCAEPKVDGASASLRYGMGSWCTRCREAMGRSGRTSRGT